MKKSLLIVIVSLSSFCGFAATGSQYVIDDQKVERLFTNSVDESISALSDKNLMAVASNYNGQTSRYMSGGDKSFVAAILLNFFLGGLGIHRLYLGTATMTWVGYILTCGGIFGVVPLVDFIVLIIHNDDISPYEDNTMFFMWG